MEDLLRAVHVPLLDEVPGLVHGFAGVRDTGGHVRVAPRLPAGWTAMRFTLHRRGSDITIALDANGATVTVESGGPVPIMARPEL